MTNKIAYFILTHERAEKQETLKTLNSIGIFEDIYLIVDDKDRQLELYKDKYKNVIVFSKEAIYDEFDAMTNEKDFKSVCFARNYAYIVAKEKGYRYFCELDDDISGLFVKMIENGKLKSKKIKEGQGIFKAMCEYMSETPIALLGGAQAGGYIGGIDGPYARGYRRDISQCFICDTMKPIKFNGLMNEDEHASLECMKSGNIAMAIYDLCIVSPQRKSNEGGLNELYRKLGEYNQMFYTKIAFPSCVKIKINKNGVSMTHNRNAMYPKILENEL